MNVHPPVSDTASGDKLTRLLEHVSLRARTFYAGPLCGLHDFSADEGVAHLHVIRAGTLRAEQAGWPEIEMREPSLLFYPRPIQHRLVIDDLAAVDIVCASVHYGAGLENTMARSLPPVMWMPFHANRRIESTLSLLFDEATDAQAGRQVMLDRLCDVLLVQIVRIALQSNVGGHDVLAGMMHSRIGPVFAEIMDHPGRHWTLASMAARSHLSRNAFARQFRETVGTAPVEFLTRVRVGLAQRLLAKGRQVSLVAHDVGYQSQPAFSRAFVRETGVSPSAWQRRSISPD